MKARILNGSLEGVEFELSDETIKNLEKEQRIKNIPEYVSQGQVYKINNSKYMVACLGSPIIGYDNRGLTVLGSWDSGCWNPGILDGTLPIKQLRKRLIELNAEYLGTFSELFKEIK